MVGVRIHDVQDVYCHWLCNGGDSIVPLYLMASVAQRLKTGWFKSYRKVLHLSNNNHR